MSNSDPGFGRPPKSYHLAIPSKTAVCVAACDTRPNFLPRRKKWISDPDAVECPACLAMMKSAPK